MYRKFIILILSVVVILAFSPVSKAVEKPLAWSLDKIEVVGRGDSLSVTFSWTVSNWEMPENKAVVMMPALRGVMGELALRPVAVYSRKLAMDEKTPLASGRRNELSIRNVPHKISFKTSDVLPRQSWMDTVRLSLSVYEWSKRDGLVLRATSQRGTFVRPKRPEDAQFPWTMKVPERATGSFREVEIECPVDFEDGFYRFDIDYGGNSAEMESFLSKVKALSSSKRFEVRSSSLILTVPPEGNPKESLKLSKNRVNSVYSYMSKQGAFKVYQPAKVGAGEDWDGVTEWVSRSAFQDDARLQEILSWSGREAEKLETISREKPAAWEEIFKRCIPYLGSVKYSVSYRPLSFSQSRFVIPVYDEMPEFLLPYDFWYLASSYGQGTPEWLEVMMTGASLHPENEALNMDVVMALIQAGRVNTASEYLRNVGSSVEGKYVYAVWLYNAGRYDEALELLEFLKDKGSMYMEVWMMAEPFISWYTGNVAWERKYY